jgi:hypothetical protein
MGPAKKDSAEVFLTPYRFFFTYPKIFLEHNFKKLGEDVGGFLATLDYNAGKTGQGPTLGEMRTSPNNTRVVEIVVNIPKGFEENVFRSLQSRYRHETTDIDYVEDSPLVQDWVIDPNKNLAPPQAKPFDWKTLPLAGLFASKQMSQASQQEAANNELSSLKVYFSDVTAKGTDAHDIKIRLQNMLRESFSGVSELGEVSKDPSAEDTVVAAVKLQISRRAEFDATLEKKFGEFFNADDAPQVKAGGPSQDAA